MPGTKNMNTINHGFGRKAVKCTSVLTTMIFLSGVGFAWGGIDDGLVAHYTFNGNTTDTSGTNDGILFGNAAFINGINGFALGVFAEGDYAEIPADTNLNLNTEFKTISVWLQAGQQVRSQAAIFDRTATSDYDLDLLTNSTPGLSELRFRAFSTSNSESIFGLVSNKQWINAVIVKSDTNISLYTNAQLAGTMTIASVKTKNNPLIVGAGGTPYLSGYGYVGLIEDLRFYNRALTSNEIQNLYFWSYPTVSGAYISAPNTFQISWNATSGQTYQVQYNTDLSSTNWSALGASILATNGTMTAIDTNVSPAGHKYYRIVLLQ
jgi:hypothetical protein